MRNSASRPCLSNTTSVTFWPVVLLLQPCWEVPDAGSRSDRMTSTQVISDKSSARDLALIPRASSVHCSSPSSRS